MAVINKNVNFAPAKSPQWDDTPIQGAMSEWLGTGLQNRSQRFESAWHLSIKKPAFPLRAFLLYTLFYIYTLFYTLYIYTLIHSTFIRVSGFYTLTNTLLYTDNTLTKTTVGWRFVVAPQERAFHSRQPTATMQSIIPVNEQPVSEWLSLDAGCKYVRKSFQKPVVHPMCRFHMAGRSR